MELPVPVAVLPQPGRHRQMRLLTVDNPLSARLPPGFFKTVPRQPGVYFFHDAADRLLYIGQSRDLRARLSSYRHVTPEQNARRTLRLVHRIARVEWRPCQTASEAIALEASLLLERRPPFNRAGVWQGAPWWFSVAAAEDCLWASLSRQPGGIGPLPSSFRYAHASLMRCTFRLLNPNVMLTDYPLGMLSSTIPLALRWRMTEAEALASASMLSTFLSGSNTHLLERLETLPPTPRTWEQDFWTAELENLRKIARKINRFTPSPSAPSDPKAVGSPLFLKGF